MPTVGSGIEIRDYPITLVYDVIRRTSHHSLGLPNIHFTRSIQYKANSSEKASNPSPSGPSVTSGRILENHHHKGVQRRERRRISVFRLQIRLVTLLATATATATRTLRPPFSLDGIFFQKRRVVLRPPGPIEISRVCLRVDGHDHLKHPKTMTGQDIMPRSRCGQWIAWNNVLQHSRDRKENMRRRKRWARTMQDISQTCQQSLALMDALNFNYRITHSIY